MFGWEFPPYNSGGLGVACEGLAKGMAENGAYVIFVLPMRIPVSSEHMRIIFANDGKNYASTIKYKVVHSLLMPYVNSEEYDEERKKISRLEAKVYGEDLAKEVLRYAARAGAIAAEEDFDVIHAHEWLTFLAGLEAKKISGKPLFLHVHATEYDRTGGTGCNEFVYAIEKEGMEKADKIIAISRYTKDIIIKQYGIDPNKIEIVHNGVATNDAGANSEAVNLHSLKESGNHIVLSMGRLTIQKGLDYFLAMAKRVLEYVPNTIFIIAGSGDLERTLITRAAELGISDRVIFPGWLRGGELESAYQLADIFVVPSVSEPFGLTVLESMARGTPVLVSKQSGVSEIVKNALKVDFWDTEEMSDKVIAVLRYGALRDQLQNYGREEVSDYSWHKAAQKCLSIFRKYL